MDYSLAYGLSHIIGKEDPNFILPYNIMNAIDDNNDFEAFGSYSSSTFNQQSSEDDDTLMIKAEYENFCNSKQMVSYTATPSTSTSTNFMAFGYPNSQVVVEEHQYYGSSQHDESMPQQILDFSSKTTMSQASDQFDDHIKIENSSMHNKSPLQVQEHVIAERLRRQKLNKLFIGLSAHIPGLKKLDKASILTDAVQYIKRLEERWKVLEEAAKNQLGISALSKRIISMTGEDDNMSISTVHQHSSSSAVLVSNVKARVCDQELLIRIHCKKTKELTVKLLGELEKLHLTIINCSVIPFATNLDITVIAQRNMESTIARNELMERVKSAIYMLCT